MSFSRGTNIVFTAFQDEQPKFDAATTGYLVFQRERCPKTGRLHFQGYAEFKRDTRLRGIQAALGTPTAHVELRKGTQAEAIEYCKKEESRAEPPVEFGTPKTEGAGNGERSGKKKDDVYRRALHCTDAESALRVIREELPTDYFKSFNGIKAAVDHRYGRKRKPYAKELQYGWKLPKEIKDWLANEFTAVERAKCLVVVGPTRLGKTAWARSLGKHMFWRGNVSYGDWDDDARYIVIDDIPWQYIPQKKSILTQMGDVTLTDKYVKKITVNNNKPTIVLMNNMPDFGDEASYWQANTTIVELNVSLIDKKQKRIVLDEYRDNEE